MNKKLISAISAAICLGCILALVFQGFALPALSPLLHVVLRVLAGLSAQAFCMTALKHPVARMLPLLVTAVIAIWGGCLFMMDFDWQNASLDGYLRDYCTPVMGCLGAMVLLQDENPRRLMK